MDDEIGHAVEHLRFGHHSRSEPSLWGDRWFGAWRMIPSYRDHHEQNKDTYLLSGRYIFRIRSLQRPVGIYSDPIADNKE